MEQNHKGKIALVTGANKGIGYEVARELGQRGVTVWLGARNADLGESAAARLRAAGADATFVELDVTSPETIANAAEAIRQRYGRPGPGFGERVSRCLRASYGRRKPDRRQVTWKPHAPAAS